MITRNTEREEKVVAAIADEVKKIEANKAHNQKNTTTTTARELQAIQMASFFVGKFYKVAELFSVEIERLPKKSKRMQLPKKSPPKLSRSLANNNSMGRAQVLPKGRKIMSKYYLHKIEMSVGRAAIVIDQNEKPVVTYTYLNGEPIIGADGERVPSKTLWTLGAVEENEANQLAFTLAEYYGCDVMKDGELLGLPYMGKAGQWVSRSEAAAALGKIKSERKTNAARENAKKGGWKKGVPRKKKSDSSDAN